VPSDVLKDPFVLEFADLRENPAAQESDLEHHHGEHRRLATDQSPSNSASVAADSMRDVQASRRAPGAAATRCSICGVTASGNR